jgi:hypothetical protein
VTTSNPSRAACCRGILRVFIMGKDASRRGRRRGPVFAGAQARLGPPGGRRRIGQESAGEVSYSAVSCSWSGYGARGGRCSPAVRGAPRLWRTLTPTDTTSRATSAPTARHLRHRPGDHRHDPWPGRRRHPVPGPSPVRQLQRHRPDDKRSAGRPVHGVNLKGNRRLNHAIHMAAHMAAITQIRNRRRPGRAYYERKLAEAKAKKEALRCLKRRISDTIYRQLVDDADRRAEAGPGGQTGTSLQSSVTGPTPTAGSSDKPQPRAHHRDYAHPSRQHRWCQSAPGVRRSRLTRSPDGAIIVEPAPWITVFRCGPWRWWNTLTRNRTSWVTVSGDQWPWRLVREKFASEEDADRRGDGLERSIADGEMRLGGPAWRRRRSS